MDKMEEFDAALVLHGVYRIRRGRDAGCYYHDVSSLEIWQCDVEEEEDGIYAGVCRTGIASRFPLADVVYWILSTGYIYTLDLISF